MLNIIDIKKTYTTQKGKKCGALNGVSISFPDKGMVFVCGKSGSGKSTLLNVMSGLDIHDSGEIIIANKSSKDFKQDDFDIYRNTYVGFIFQDFSIIDDMTVRENIELSLRLQNQTCTDEDIEEALKSVSLEGYGDRKSFELSGGQKQRVAIARSIVKNPKIVFADEPTGSLDSNTGKQIFDLFKKLSKKCLVIVVTHDMDNAITYGDRIIELADGLIISDKTKLHKVDLDALKNQYQKSIDESFVSTTFEDKQNKEKFQKTNVHLPMKHALKIALSNFRTKKVRFAFTLILTVLALSIFGLSSSLKNYNYQNSSIETFESLGIDTVLVTKLQTEIDDNNVETTSTIALDSQDFINFETNGITTYKNYTQELALPIYATPPEEEDGTDFSNTINSVVEMTSTLDDSSINGFYGATKLLGTYPELSTSSIEIMISDYTADSIMYFGAKFDDGDVLPNSGYENILNKTITISSIPFVITGIFSTDYTSMVFDRNTQVKFNTSNVYTAALTVKDAVYNYAMHQSIVASSVYVRNNDTDYTLPLDLYVAGLRSVSNVISYNPLFLMVPVTFIAGYTPNTQLADDEVVISFSELASILDRYEMDSLGNFIFTYDNMTAADFEDLSLSLYLNSSDTTGIMNDIKVVGVFDDSDITDFYNVFITNENFKNTCVEGALVSPTVFIPLSEDRAANISLLQYLDSQSMNYAGYPTSELQMLDVLFGIISKMLEGASLVLLFFVLLLMYNFISVSVMNKKKEIGILRAMGARGIDVAKIFMFEGVFIAIVNIILSTIIIVLGTTVLNTSLTNTFEYKLQAITLQPTTLLLVVAMCILVVLIASALPLIRIIRMKPIDAIKII
ncbi:MAG: ATP-binding cassette domain-containing protein [Spirochaetales bacterium]